MQNGSLAHFAASREIVLRPFQECAGGAALRWGDRHEAHDAMSAIKAQLCAIMLQ